MKPADRFCIIQNVGVWLDEQCPVEEGPALHCLLQAAAPASLDPPRILQQSRSASNKALPSTAWSVYHEFADAGPDQLTPEAACWGEEILISLLLQLLSSCSEACECVHQVFEYGL